MPVSEIGQRLDDPAFAGDAAGAAFRHAPQLGAQRMKAAQPGVDLGDLRRGQRMRRAAIRVRVVREVEQCADRPALEAQFSRMADEAEATQMGLAIDAVPAFAAGGGAAASLPARTSGWSSA